MPEARKPHLEVVSVVSALEAMRQARPLGFAHPLAQFISLRRFDRPAASLGGDAATDALIFEGLGGIIRTRLNQHRRVCGLPRAAREDDGAALRDDFRIGNAALEAWSLLYYRYVRVDLGLSPEALALRAGQSERTLNRRQRAGIVRLTHDLVRREMRARDRARQAVLRARLPGLYPPPLVGRDALLVRGMERLAASVLPRHLLLHGGPGIGKTALALALAHRLIDERIVHNVAWVTQPDTDLDRLSEAIAVQLGLPLALESHPPLPVYLQLVDSLIVLDESDLLIGAAQAFRRLLTLLGAGRVLICAMMPPEDASLDLAQLEVPPLDHDSALLLLERRAADLGRAAEDVEHFNALYEEVGGNPGALRMAIGMGRRYRLARVSAAFYESPWRACSPAERLLWLALALRPKPVSDSSLAGLSPDLSEEDRQAAVAVLEARSVLERSPGEAPQFALTPLARAFAGRMLRERAARSLVTAAVQHVADDLTRADPETGEVDVAAHAYFLEQVQRAEVSPRLLLDLAYTFAPVLEGGGAWLAWAHYLEPLHDLLVGAPEADRLWLRLRLGVARRWLAHWAEAIYHLAAVIEEAGAAGLFGLQAEAMIELAAVYRYRRELNTADQLLSRVAAFFQRNQQPEGYQRAMAARIQVALEGQQFSAVERYLAEAGLDASSEKLHDVSPHLLSLAAHDALRKKATDDALRFATAAQHRLRNDLPNLARLAALLGQVHYQRHAWEAAVDFMTWSLAMMEQTNDLLGHARARLNLALMFIGRGNLRAARRYLHGLPDEFERLGDVNGLQTALRNLEIIRRASRPG